MNWRIWGIVCAVLSSNFISGCSGSSDRPKLQQVRLAATLGSFGHLPVYLASALGYFHEEGIEVTISDMGGTSKVMEALLGGSADVGAGALEQSIQMAAEGHAIQSFVTEFYNFGFLLAASPKASRQIRKIEDLRGATVGISSPGSGTHFFLNYILNRHGLRPSDISTVAIGLGASNLSSLEQGRVDAGITTPTVLVLLQRRRPDTVILFDPLFQDSFKMAFGVDRYPSHVLYARLDWIHRNKETVRSLAKAVVRALQFVVANSPETIALKLPDGYRSQDRSIDVQALRTWHSMYSRDGLMPPESFEAVKNVVALSIDKVRSATIDPAMTYTNEFVK